jgi:hypothetical protein
MKLYYIANVRIPTEKAHGVAIVKACEAFAKTGVETELIVPKRRTPYEKDVYETYDVERNFIVKFLPTVDFISSKSGRAIFLASKLEFSGIALFLSTIQKP